jgi:hypothetical protein
VLVWVCDANARQFRSLGLVPYVVNSFGGDSVVVTDWQTDNFVLYAPLAAKTEMRVWLSGADSTLSATDTAPASQVISPYCSAKLDSLRALPRASLH